MHTVCSATTVKASLEETTRFVNYHLNSGVDHMILFFDDPADVAVPVLSAYSAVTCVRCDAAYWAGVDEVNRNTVIRRQGYNATLALQMAREQGLDWLLHIDVDELLYSRSGLKAVLSAAPPEKDTVVFRSWEAVPEHLCADKPFSSRFFRVLPWPRRRWPKFFTLAARLGCEKYFLEGRYFRGHQVGKSAVRTSSDPYRINPHKPLFHDRKCRPFLNHDAVVLHFESNGFDAWMEKMRYWIPQEWAENPRSKTLTPQLTKFAKVCEDGGPDQTQQFQALYKDLYFIDPAGRLILRLLGLLKKVKINPSRFKPPINTV